LNFTLGKQLLCLYYNTPFRIPVKWEMQVIMDVYADSLKQAVQIINRKDYDLPNGEIVNDTFEIDYDRLEN